MTNLEEAAGRVDGVADQFLDGRHIPGVAYGMILGGELVHSRGIGTLRVGEEATPDADSVFRIASMTKSFTAATIVGLRDEGRLALDDPIARHVPELAGLHGPTADSPPITVRHLMTMSSGLATDDPWADRQEGLDLAAFAELLRGPLTFAWAPGTRFEYSNLGYGILGRLITNVAGAEYREVVAERLFEPLGLSATTYLAETVPPERLAHGYVRRDPAYVDEPMDPYGALASMGGIFSSVRDLARWVAFLSDAFPPRDDPEGGAPLSRSSRREMQRVHQSWPPELTLASPDGQPALAGGGYGLGLGVIDDLRRGRMVTHSGGYPGFGSSMRWHPASGLGVIALANHRYAPMSLLAQRLLNELLAIDLAPARRIRPAARTAAAQADVERLLAAWDDGIADRLFAMNIELDEPIERRRAAIDRIREAYGRLRADPDLPGETESPLHAAWWLAGERGGRVRVEIRLSPEGTALVQTLALTAVPEPSATLDALARAVVSAVNGPDPAIPGNIELGAEIDPNALIRVIRIVAARYAPLAVGPAVGGNGTTTATWRLRSDRGELELTVALGDDTGLVTKLDLTQRPPAFPPHAD